MQKMLLKIWMAAILGAVVFELSFQRVEAEMIAGQVDAMEEDMVAMMIQKQSAIIATDLVIGHAIVQKRGTKANVIIVENLDTSSVIALQNEGVSGILHEARGAADLGVVARGAAEVPTGAKAHDEAPAEVPTGAEVPADQEVEAPEERADRTEVTR